MKRFKKLLADLEQQGYGVHAEDTRALIKLPDGESTFVLLAADEWIQVAGVLLEADEMRGEGQARLGDFILLLQGRYLGCRFGYEDDGALKIVEDVYPDRLDASHLMAVMSQLDHVGGAVLPLLKDVIATGQLPVDEEIDAAFGVRVN